MIAFGTGGWRAIIGDDFTRENVQRLTLAVARRMKREENDDRGFCIGYDRRFLSARGRAMGGGDHGGGSIFTRC